MEPRCELCGGTDDLSYCSVCKVHFCASCRINYPARVLAAFTAAYKKVVARYIDRGLVAKPPASATSPPSEESLRA
jgi:hypothetical protein